MYLLAELQQLWQRNVTIREPNHCFHVFVKHHCSSNSFFKETISKKYMLYLSSGYEIKCLGEIYEQSFCLKIFRTYSFNDTIDYQNLGMLWIDSFESRSNFY